MTQAGAYSLLTLVAMFTSEPVEGTDGGDKPKQERKFITYTHQVFHC
jgi:hypothetical protein